MIKLAKPMIGTEERAAVDRVLCSGSLSQGAEVAAFESEFSALVDGRRCIAVNSGTSALHLALVAAGIGPGNEVIVPSFTFAATANAVVLAGGTPVFADIELGTFGLDPDAVADAISPRTAAIVPVHLYGHVAPMRELSALAGRHGLLIVEDAAQAHAASMDGRPAGAWGDAAAFSFYPSKNMTTGEGGMVVTDDPLVERRVRLLRSQGMDIPYRNEIVGYNMRMTDLAAAIGRVQLRRLPSFTAARRSNASTLTSSLGSVDDVTPPIEATGSVHVYHQYTVRTSHRDALQMVLERAGIENRVYYPTPVHALPAYDLHLQLPNTAEAAATVLSLPVGPHLSGDDVLRIASVVSTAVEFAP